MLAHTFSSLLQFLLTPSPAKSHFLTPEERTWLQNRQDTQHKLSSERNPHQGAWWGESLPQIHVTSVWLQVT